MRSIVRRTPAVVIALAALVAALSGTALAAKLITSKDIKNNTIKSGDIRNGAVKPLDLSKKAKATLQGPAGPKVDSGPKGDAGPKGETGPTGPVGPSETFLEEKETHNLTVIPASELVFSTAVAQGSYVYAASFGLENTDNAAGDFRCTLTQTGTDALEIPVARTTVTLDPGEFAAVALTGGHVISVDGSEAKLRCEALTNNVDNAQLDSPSLVITKVGAIS